MSEITAIGVFEDREKALAAVEALRRAGFAEKEIGLVSRDDRKIKRSAEAASILAEQGAIDRMVDVGPRS